MKKPKTKSTAIVLVFLIIVILCLGGFLIWKLIYSDRSFTATVTSAPSTTGELSYGGYILSDTKGNRISISTTPGLLGTGFEKVECVTMPNLKVGDKVKFYLPYIEPQDLTMTTSYRICYDSRVDNSKYFITKL